MIIWRGWGILAFLTIGVEVGVMALLDETVGIADGGQTTGIIFGVAGILTCILAWVLNFWLADRRTAKHAELIRADVDRHVAAGVFHAPGFPPPTTLAEARYQADAVVAAETLRARKQWRTHNTLFFVPLHYLGPALIVIAIIAFATTLL